MRADDCDRLGPVMLVTRCGGQPECPDVIDKPTQRRSRGAAHVLLRHVEQRGDRIEVTVGLCADRAAAFAGGEPAALQTGPVPGLPQRVARIVPVGRAAPRGGQHGAHPPQRAAQFGGQSRRLSVQRRDEQGAELPRRLRSVGAAQRPPQLPQRHRVDPADGAGQQRKRLRAVEFLRSGLQDGQQRAHGRLVGQRRRRHRQVNRDTREGECARERDAQPRHRAHDDRHL